MPNDAFTGSSSGAWATNGNWESGTAPATTGENVVFDGRMTQALVGSDASATTLDSLRVYMNALYSFGSKASNMIVKATKAEFGYAAADGSSGAGSTVYWDASSAQTALVVYNTSSSGSVGLPPFNFKGSHSSNTVLVYNGIVGIGTSAVADTATVTDLNVKGGTVTVTNGCTLTTVTVTGGTVYLNSAVTTLNIFPGATVYHNGTVKITTVNGYGGTLIESARPSSGNTIDTLNLFGVTLDMRDNKDAFTIGTTNIKDGGGKILLATPSQGTFTTIADSLTRSTSIQFLTT